MATSALEWDPGTLGTGLEHAGAWTAQSFAR